MDSRKKQNVFIVQDVVTKDGFVVVPNDPVKLFFDISYYLCFCPFRLKLMSGSYKISAWLPQQVICLLITSLSFLQSFSSLRFRFYKDHDGDASLLIETLRVITGRVKLAVMFYGFWFWRNTYESIANGRLNNIESCNQQKTGRVIRTICILCLILSPLLTSLLPNIISIMEDPWLRTRCYSLHGRFDYMFASPPNCSVSGILAPPTYGDIWLSIAHVLGVNCIVFAFAICSTHTFVHVWSLWDVVANRIKLWRRRVKIQLSEVTPAQNSTDEIVFSWHKVFLRLNELSEFSNIINQGISTHLALSIVGETFYYPIALCNIFRPKGVKYLVYLCLDMAQFGCQLVMAAEVKASARQYIKDLTLETYKMGISKEHDTGDILATLVENIAVRFTGRYDVDFAFLGPLSDS